MSVILSTKRNRVILLDVHNLMYRTHYANATLTSDSGFPTSAMHGVIMIVARHRIKYPDAEFVFLWDGPEHSATGVRSWRYKAFPDYKVGRTLDESSKAQRALVHKQMRPLFTLLHYAGYLQYRVPGVEADDLAGIIVAKMYEEFDILIDTNDKDYYQLFTYEGVKIIHKGGILDVKGFIHKHKMHPNFWTRYRAFVGDPSDSIPGVKGIGPVRATKLMCEGVPPYPWDVQPTSVQKAVPEDKWADVVLYESLSRIVVDQHDRRLGAESDTLVEQLGTRSTRPKPQLKKFLWLAAKYNLATVIKARRTIVEVD